MGDFEIVYSPAILALNTAEVVQSLFLKAFLLSVALSIVLLFSLLYMIYRLITSLDTHKI